jgi:hypothetical protein
MRRWIFKACIIYILLCSVVLVCSGQRKVRQFIEPNQPQEAGVPKPMSTADLPSRFLFSLCPLHPLRQFLA